MQEHHPEEEAVRLVEDREGVRSSYGERFVSAGPNIVTFGHGVPSLLQVATIL